MPAPPEFEETDIGPDPRPGRSAALQWFLVAGLFLVVAAAVIAGILLVWAAVQPVLPSPGPALQTSRPAAFAGP